MSEDTGVRFRAAVEADLPAMVAMLADDALGARREALGPPLDAGYAAAFAAIQRDPNQLLAVAEQAGELVGMLQITFLPGLSHRGAWRGQIESVRIAGAQRGSGLGQAMMRWAIERCRERGCRMVQLTTDRSRVDAHRFYERLGFLPSHAGYKLSISPPA